MQQPCKTSARPYGRLWLPCSVLGSTCPQNPLPHGHQRCPVPLPAGKVLDPGVGVSVRQHRGGGWAARDAHWSARFAVLTQNLGLEGLPCPPRAGREAETCCSKDSVSCQPRASCPPSRATPSMPLPPSSIPRDAASSRGAHTSGRVGGHSPGHSRLGEVSLQHGLDGQVSSLRVLAEVLLGAKLVLQRGGKVPHVLAGGGLQRENRCPGAGWQSGGSQAGVL